MKEEQISDSHANNLRPMIDAPAGEEILAWSTTGGNFHQVKRNGSGDRFGMRWNAEYSQHTSDYSGWIPMPTCQLGVSA